MIKVLLLFLVFFIFFIRLVILKIKGKRYEFLYLSTGVQLMVLNLGLPLVNFYTNSIGNELEIEKLGALANSIRLEGITILGFIVLILSKLNKTYHKFYPNKKILVSIIVIGAISLINPFNEVNEGVYVFFSVFFQLYFYCCVIINYVDKKDVFLGLYDGLSIVISINFILAICYPILNIDAAAKLFRSSGSFENSLRREGYKSAIGVFEHPGNLALYALYSSCYFIVCYLKKYKEKLSLCFFLICLFLIFFTYSRTTYIVSFFTYLFMYLASLSNKELFSFKLYSKLLIALFFVVIIFVFSPLSTLFFESDSDEQFLNRFSHWFLGLEIFHVSPWIGVGINSHVYFMSHALIVKQDLPILWFLISQPIHSVHFIILAELGIIGLLLFYYFVGRNIQLFRRVSFRDDKLQYVYNYTCIGILIAFISYGSFGWSPFTKECLGLSFLVYFIAVNEKLGFSKKSKSAISVQ